MYPSSEGRKLLPSGSPSGLLFVVVVRFVRAVPAGLSSLGVSAREAWFSSHPPRSSVFFEPLRSWRRLASGSTGHAPPRLAPSASGGGRFRDGGTTSGERSR